MIVLFKDKLDGTLVAAEVEISGYDPSENELWFNISDYGNASIKGITRSVADYFITNLFSLGKADLTAYFAEFDYCDKEEVIG